MPAATSFPSVGSSRDAGPIVQIIFALRMDAGAYGHTSAPARMQQRADACAEKTCTAARALVALLEVEVALRRFLVFAFVLVLALFLVEQCRLACDRRR